MLVFECPSCKTKMQAAEEHAGKTTICPDCGVKVPIPSSDAGAGAITTEPTAAPPAPKPDAITTPAQTHAPKKSRDRDDDDGDLPRHRDVGTSVGTGAAVGMGVGMIVLIVVGIVGCVGIGVVAILIALLVPAVQKVREAAARTQTINNMKQMALACQSHHDQFRFLPGPKMLSQQAGNQPVDLSWRVTILPFIEQAPLFNQFDQTAAWDNARNQPFVNRRPFIYENLTRPDNDKTVTHFQYFTGQNTLFADPNKRWTFANIPDGASNTFLFAEAQTPVTWSKPADMIVTPQGELPLPKDRFLAAMADASVRMIDRSRTSEQTLRLAIDPNDGNALPMDFDR